MIEFLLGMVVGVLFIQNILLDRIATALEK